MVLMLDRFIHLIMPLALLCVIAGPVQAAHLAGSEYRITSYISDQIDPAVYGDNIVYSDSAYLCLYNISSRTENLTSIPIASRTDIDGYRIVWWRDRHINELNISSGEFVWIATTDARTREPAVSGNRVFWPDGITYGNTRLYQFDLTNYQETHYTTITNGQSFDRIRADDDKLVYSIVQSGLGDIFLYDMTRLTQITVCSDPNNQLGAVISGDKVAWQDNRTGDWNIFCMNIRDA
jgi:beta propeller repeat protein